MTYADWLALVTLAAAFAFGFRNGVLREVTGVAATAAGWFLGSVGAGLTGAALSGAFALDVGNAHLIAFWLLFLVAFVTVMALGTRLDRVEHARPALVLSSVAGGLAAALKAAFFLWAVLFVALFFPIRGDVRATLRRSPSVAFAQRFDRYVFDPFRASMPKWSHPAVDWIIRHHRV